MLHAPSPYIIIPSIYSAALLLSFTLIMVVMAISSSSSFGVSRRRLDLGLLGKKHHVLFLFWRKMARGSVPYSYHHGVWGKERKLDFFIILNHAAMMPMRELALVDERGMSVIIVPDQT
jgi:hypothetical protein